MTALALFHTKARDTENSFSRATEGSPEFRRLPTSSHSPGGFPRLPLESVTPIAEKPPSSLFRRSYLLTTCLICSVLAKSNSHAIIIDINVFNPLSLVANLGQQPL